MSVQLKHTPIGRAASSVFQAIFPNMCLSCGVSVAEQGVICPQCWSDIIFIEQPYCDVTGLPFQHDFGQDVVSAEALANPPDFHKARSAAAHNGVARQLVQRLKYGDRTDLAPWLANWMIRAGSALLDDADILVPVPLHGRRYWSRRYNQSAELARPIARKTGIDFAPQALKRVKATQQQVGLKAAQRQENVRGAFKVPPEQNIAIAGRKVLLIDDVFTTGATVNSAARTLKKAGARQVDVLTFSRVVPWMGFGTSTL